MVIAIRVENLSKNFGHVRAVDNISFTIGKGEVVGLLGPNGAGKTTTMRIIAGFIAPTEGRVSVDNDEVSEKPMVTRQKIGYLPENCPLYQDMFVTDFLGYVADLRKIPVSEKEKRIHQMIETCGLESAAGRPISELSRGFKQRVGLAQALIHHPPILILDEPTSGLDPNQIIEIRNLIKEIGKERTVILSTHILQEVEAACSQALIINEGSIVGQGTLDELLHQCGGYSHYHVVIHARKDEIESRLNLLQQMSVSKWGKEGDSNWQAVYLRSGDSKDRSEELFKWVVQNGWSLRKLTRERASLEDVFKNLTT